MSGVEDKPRGWGGEECQDHESGSGIAAVCCVSLENPPNLSEPYFPSC